jgi:hypothetical protein
MALYWMLWKAKLWKIHVITFAFVTCLAFLIVGERGSIVTRVLISVLAGAASILYYALFPLVSFKGDQRVLIANATGIQTTIGRKSGEITWAEVKSIEAIGNRTHIVRKNLNTFIVPARAFSSQQEANKFFETVTVWHKGRS